MSKMKHIDPNRIAREQLEKQYVSIEELNQVLADADVALVDAQKYYDQIVAQENDIDITIIDRESQIETLETNMEDELSSLDLREQQEYTRNLIAYLDPENRKAVRRSDLRHHFNNERVDNTKVVKRIKDNVDVNSVVVRKGCSYPKKNLVSFENIPLNGAMIFSVPNESTVLEFTITTQESTTKVLIGITKNSESISTYLEYGLGYITYGIYEATGGDDGRRRFVVIENKSDVINLWNAGGSMNSSYFNVAFLEIHSLNSDITVEPYEQGHPYVLNSNSIIADLYIATGEETRAADVSNIKIANEDPRRLQHNKALDKQPIKTSNDVGFRVLRVTPKGYYLNGGQSAIEGSGHWPYDDGPEGLVRSFTGINADISNLFSSLQNGAVYRAAGFVVINDILMPIKTVMHESSQFLVFGVDPMIDLGDDHLTKDRSERTVVNASEATLGLVQNNFPGVVMSNVDPRTPDDMICKRAEGFDELKIHLGHRAGSNKNDEIIGDLSETVPYTISLIDLTIIDKLV